MQKVPLECKSLLSSLPICFLYIYSENYQDLSDAADEQAVPDYGAEDDVEEEEEEEM